MVSGSVCRAGFEPLVRDRNAGGIALVVLTASDLDNSIGVSKGRVPHLPLSELLGVGA